jgi:hypothetical protein
MNRNLQCVDLRKKVLKAIIITSSREAERDQIRKDKKKCFQYGVKVNMGKKELELSESSLSKWVSLLRYYHLDLL